MGGGEGDSLQFAVERGSGGPSHLEAPEGRVEDGVVPGENIGEEGEEEHPAAHRGVHHEDELEELLRPPHRLQVPRREEQDQNIHHHLGGSEGDD